MGEHSIREVLHAHRSRLMAIPGVVGTAEGERDDGSPCILVLVEARSASLEEALPSSLGGYPVEVRSTGAFEARPGGDE